MLSLLGAKLSRWRCHNGVADERVLRYVAASVGGLDSTRRFDVHSSCFFKDLETDYPVCFYRKREESRVCTCGWVRAHRIPTGEPVARCTVKCTPKPLFF